MKQYHKLLEDILDNGSQRSDRTGTGTISLFGHQSRYDLRCGFPAVTTKKLFWKGVVHELIWFLRGDTNVKYLLENGVRIWNDWPYKEFKHCFPEVSVEQWEQMVLSFDPGWVGGECGPVYGRQWRSWPKPTAREELDCVDQISDVIDSIKRNPFSRRHIVNAWNVSELDEMLLPPCHLLFQFYVSNDGELSCQLYQRSADAFLGVPFNIASYALLTHMIAQVCGLKVGEFIHTIGDAHIYLNHIDQVNEQLSRDSFDLPELGINPEIDNIDDFTFDDVKLVNYKSHPSIKAEISV